MTPAARVWIAVLVLMATPILCPAGYGQTPAPMPTPAPSPPTFAPAAPFIIGTAFIQGLPANTGTIVAVLGAVGSSRDYQLCGNGAVGQPPPGAPAGYSPQPGAFAVTIDASQPACVSQTTTYNFYVDAVWAGTRNNAGITARGGYLSQVTLNVPIVAVATQGIAPSASAAPNGAIYFYGQVENLNQTPADGVTVNVVAEQNQQCSGQGKSFDLKYTPAAAPTQTIIKPGFFIAPMTSGGGRFESCGRLVDVYLNGIKLSASRSFNPASPSASAIDLGVLQLPF